jgi:hypothetical protein
MIRPVNIALRTARRCSRRRASRRRRGSSCRSARRRPSWPTRRPKSVVDNCSACHSLDYITTQPRGKGEQFWRDAVAKMVNVYKAPLSPEDADAVAATLARKFG